MCPTIQEDYIKHVYAVDGGFNGQPQRKYDLFPTMERSPKLMLWEPASTRFSVHALIVSKIIK